MSLYDLRYGSQAQHRKRVAIAHQTLEEVGSLCAWCMKKKVQDIHHTQYCVKEIIGINYFGVCELCHIPICHDPQNWIIHKHFPELLNKNTPEFVKKLQANYRKLQQKYGKE